MDNPSEHNGFLHDPLLVGVVSDSFFVDGLDGYIDTCQLVGCQSYFGKTSPANKFLEVIEIGSGYWHGLVVLIVVDKVLNDLQLLLTLRINDLIKLVVKT